MTVMKHPDCQMPFHLQHDRWPFSLAAPFWMYCCCTCTGVISLIQFQIFSSTIFSLFQVCSYILSRYWIDKSTLLLHSIAKFLERADATKTLFNRNKDCSNITECKQQILNIILELYLYRWELKKAVCSSPANWLLSFT